MITMTAPQMHRNECSINGMATHFAAKPMDLLTCLLLSAPDRFVRNAELIEAMWPDPDCEPDGASHCVSVYLFRLRRAGVPIESDGRTHGCNGWRIPEWARGHQEMRMAA